MIYLDHAATTPLDPGVFAAMVPYFTDEFANASSLTHAPGHRAQRAVQTARQQLAALLNARPQELTFTGSATEANNLAILGVTRAARARGARPHIITQATEHASVLEPCHQAVREGAELTVLPVDTAGRISLDELASALRRHTTLVSIQAANQELGTLQGVREIARLCGERNILFHTDATQAVGKIPFDLQAAGIDLLTLSGHKFGGPKGAAALYIRGQHPPVELHPLHFGGQQERGIRPGTLNVPAIVGLGKAAEVAAARLDSDPASMVTLREHLERTILEMIPHVVIHAAGAARVPTITSLTVIGVDAEALLPALPELAIASGSACSSATRQASSVLLAIGLSENYAHATIRLSLGRTTTRQEVDTAVSMLAAAVARLRSLDPSA